MSLKDAICLLLISFVIGSCTTDDNFYTLEDFTKIKKVDAHVHLNVKDSSMASLATRNNIVFLTVNIDEGIDSVLAQQNTAHWYVNNFPGRIFYLGTFASDDFDSTNWAQRTTLHLQEAVKNGARGFKVWKNIGMDIKDSLGNYVLVDNPVFSPVFAFAQREQVTVLCHVGDSKNCWLPLDKMTVKFYRDVFGTWKEHYMFLYPERPSYEAHMNARDTVLQRHPEVKMVGAHLGCLDHDLKDLAARLDKYPNFAVDIAARMADLQNFASLDNQSTREFLIKYQDRILYGSDFILSQKDTEGKAAKELEKGWLNDWKFLVTDSAMTSGLVDKEFKGLKLPKEVIDKIYYQNAINWYKIKV